MDHTSDVTQRNLAELTDMIRMENDADKRSILLVCQGMMSELAQLAHIFDGMRRDHTSRINDHQFRIEKHDTFADRAQTMLRFCILLVTISSGSVAVAGSYAYTLIAELRDNVTKHEVIIGTLLKSAKEQQ